MYLGFFLLHDGDFAAVEDIKSGVIGKKDAGTHFEACIYVQIGETRGSFALCDLLGQFLLLCVLLSFGFLCCGPVHQLCGDFLPRRPLHAVITYSVAFTTIFAHNLEGAVPENQLLAFRKWNGNPGLLSTTLVV